MSVSAPLPAPRDLPAETRPLDVRRQPEAHQARLPEAYLDDARMSAAILRLPRLEAARDEAVPCLVVIIIADGSVVCSCWAGAGVTGIYSTVAGAQSWPPQHSFGYQS